MGDAAAEAVEARTRLGPRADRRGQPRIGTTAAAAGAFVVFSGAMTLALDATEGGDDGGVSTTPGTLITLAVVIAGYAVLATQKRGPLATAGLVAFAVALPFFVGYATFDETGFPPISLDAVLGVSALGWGAAYVVGPSRGRPFLLGAALLGAWLFFLEQITGLFTSPFSYLGQFMVVPIDPIDEFDDFGGPQAFDAPDPTEIAIVCLAFALLYLVGSHLLDRRGLPGAATPMVAIGHVAAIAAVFAFTDDLQEIGTGLLAVAIGVALLFRGAATSRRATNWIGGIYLVAGVQSVVSGITDSATTGGVLLLGIGAVLVVLAAFFVAAADEPDDDQPGPSFPDGVRRRVAVAGGEAAAASATDGPPAEGWWIASDGNWYPPDQHPDAGGDA